MTLEKDGPLVYGAHYLLVLEGHRTQHANMRRDGAKDVLISSASCSGEQADAIRYFIPFNISLVSQASKLTQLEDTVLCR